MSIRPINLVAPRGCLKSGTATSLILYENFIMSRNSKVFNNIALTDLDI